MTTRRHSWPPTKSYRKISGTSIIFVKHVALFSHSAVSMAWHEGVEIMWFADRGRWSNYSRQESITRRIEIEEWLRLMLFIIRSIIWIWIWKTAEIRWNEIELIDGETDRHLICEKLHIVVAVLLKGFSWPFSESIYRSSRKNCSAICWVFWGGKRWNVFLGEVEY